MATLLSIIQDMTSRSGIPQPTEVVGNTSRSIIQLLGLLNEVGENLVTRNFKQLERRTTFISVATEIQGALETIAPDFNRVISDTMWDLTQMMFMGAVSSPQDWEYRKVSNLTGPFYRFRLMVDPTTMKNSIYLNPAPSAGHTMGFEYYSKYWACGVTSGNLDPTKGRYALAADDDVILLPEIAVKADLKWRWRREKGLPYDDDKAEAEAIIDSMVAQSDPVGAVTIGQTNASYFIGPWNIPDGNYTQ